MNKIFKEEAIQTAFEEKGYVVFPFLNEAEVENLKSAYHEQAHAFDKGFHASMYNANPAYRMSLDKAITPIVNAKLDEQFIDYHTVYSNFMVKEPGIESEMYVHQDWTYVDENQYTSVAIWIPLVDVDAKNGALCVLEKSHLIENKIRGYGTFDPYFELRDQIKENYLKLIPMKAGEAIVWHHRVVHASPPNLSDQTRIVATSILVPKVADVYHYYRGEDEPEDRVEKFNADNAFYMGYALSKRPPKSRSLGVISDKFDSLTEADLQALQSSPVVQEKQPEPEAEKKGFLHSLLSVFNKS